MQNYLETLDKAGDQAVSALRKAEDAVVSAVSQVSEFVGDIVPELPTLPLADQIAPPKDMVRTSFEFAQKLLDSQKEYTLALLKAIEPITTKVIPNGTRKAAKKSSATKASSAA